MKSVLILNPHIDQAAAFARLLRGASDKYRIVGWDEVDRRPFLHQSYYDKILIQPFEEAGIEDAYDYVIPTGADSTYRFIQSRGQHHLGEILFSKESLKVYDKRFLLETAAQANIPIPRMYDSADAVREFPVFVKDAFENQHATRQRFLAHSRELLPANGDDCLIQEYIDTPFTYGLGFLAQGGKILTHFLHQELVSIPRQGGSAVILRPFHDARLIEYSRKLLQALQFDGWGLVEFKYCQNRDDFVLMEINAKFWESLEFALRSHPDFLNHLLALPRRKEEIEQAIYLKRYMMLPLSGQLKHLKDLASSYRLDRDQLGRLLASRYLPESLRQGVKKLMANFIRK